MTHSARCYDAQGRPTGTRLFTPAEEARLDALRAGSRQSAVGSGDDAPEAADSRWRVALTEPQQETLAAAGLVGHRFEAYGPSFLARVGHNYGRSRVIRRPLFPGYLFVRLSLEDPHWPRLFSTPGVRGVLVGAGDAPVAVDAARIDDIRAKEAEIAAQWQALESGDVDALPFGPGDTVQLDDPTWSGMLGRIERLDDMQRIVVLMSLFGRETRIVVSAGMIRTL